MTLEIWLLMVGSPQSQNHQTSECREMEIEIFGGISHLALLPAQASNSVPTTKTTKQALHKRIKNTAELRVERF